MTICLSRPHKACNRRLYWHVCRNLSSSILPYHRLSTVSVRCNVSHCYWRNDEVIAVTTWLPQCRPCCLPCRQCHCHLRSTFVYEARVQCAATAGDIRATTTCCCLPCPSLIVSCCWHQRHLPPLQLTNCDCLSPICCCWTRYTWRHQFTHLIWTLYVSTHKKKAGKTD